MFIRKTQVQKKRVGGHYYTYRIVESLRTGKEVRQQILLNLGADFSLPEEKWPILTKRIQEILHGQLSIFDIDCKIDKLARNFAAKIIIKQQDKSESIVDYREVDINSLEMSRPRSVGCEHVTLEALRSLGLDTKLAELGFTRPQVALAIGTIVARACHPASERDTHRWLQDQSGLGELIGHDFEQSSLYKLYQISDQLFKKKIPLPGCQQEKTSRIR